MHESATYFFLKDQLTYAHNRAVKSSGWSLNRVFSCLITTILKLNYFCDLTHSINSSSTNNLSSPANHPCVPQLLSFLVVPNVWFLKERFFVYENYVKFDRINDAFPFERKIVLRKFSQSMAQSIMKICEMSASPNLRFDWLHLNFNLFMFLFHSVFYRRIDDFILILQELFQLLQVTPRIFIIIHLHTHSKREEKISLKLHTIFKASKFVLFSFLRHRKLF